MRAFLSALSEGVMVHAAVISRPSSGESGVVVVVCVVWVLVAVVVVALEEERVDVPEGVVVCV